MGLDKSGVVRAAVPLCCCAVLFCAVGRILGWLLLYCAALIFGPQPVGDNSLPIYRSDLDVCRCVRAKLTLVPSLDLDSLEIFDGSDGNERCVVILTCCSGYRPACLLL